MAKTMKVTALLSVVVTILMTILYKQFTSAFCLTLAITFGTISYHFVMRLLVGKIVDQVMDNKADYNKKWYQLHSFEKPLYDILKVKRWKGKMPAYAPQLFDTKEHSLDEIVQAMCQAEIVHEIIVPLSFLPLLTVPLFGSFGVFLITSILAAAFDLMFVIMQRYNRPRIIRILRRNHKKI